MAEKVRRLLLVRHGQTAWNAEGRAQGQSDVDLDATGEAQAARVARGLRPAEPTALWSSDLRRARRTAEAVGSAAGVSVGSDVRLREYDLGARSGMTPQEFAATYPEEYASWRRGDQDHLVPGEETHAAVAERMGAALTEIRDALAPGDSAVVVAHGACLRTAVVALLGFAPAERRIIRGMDNCRWAELRYDERGVRLAGYNQGPDFVPGDPAR